MNENNIVTRQELIETYYKSLLFNIQSTYCDIPYIYSEEEDKIICLGFNSMEDKHIVVPIFFDMLYIKGDLIDKTLETGVFTNKNNDLESLDLGGISEFMYPVLLRENLKEFKANKLTGELPFMFGAFTNVVSVELDAMTRLNGGITFLSCKNLKRISLKSLMEMEPTTFAECESLEEVDIRSLRHLHTSTFSDCTKLKRIWISKECKIDEDILQSELANKFIYV